MAVSSPDMSTETPASDELEARVRALEAETVAAREALEAATPTLPEVPASDATPAVPPEELASDATPTPPEPPASDETPAVRTRLRSRGFSSAQRAPIVPCMHAA